MALYLTTSKAKTKEKHGVHYFYRTQTGLVSYQTTSIIKQKDPHIVKCDKTKEIYGQTNRFIISI